MSASAQEDSCIVVVSIFRYHVCNKNWVTIIGLATVALEFFFYGAYAILYTICIHVLTSRKVPRYRAHCFIMTLLFLFSTIGIAVNTLIVFAQIPLYDPSGALSAQLTPYQLRNAAVVGPMMCVVASATGDVFLVISAITRRVDLDLIKPYHLSSGGATASGIPASEL
ncbi:hypothetical protein E1B28_006591 [Marasmius oreades]|uniref:Uncharacterized protein n=1 Tax=Marasmius oreades TaxID=181124 RepID=A0A9P7UWF9_9AGAR|nr:uncharacterized protein E1B28_006591 [Marasmius oreades]KAG7095904.1 hypothetical protein E1B28_006591 [Marasmius oreades]